MRIDAIIVAILLASQSLSLADSAIPANNRAILSEAPPKILGCNRFWTPELEDTEKAMKAITKYLKNPENHKNEFQKQEIPKILKNFSQYHVQFVGIIVDGKKRIHCNFFKVIDEMQRWKESYHFVFDGGFWYWRIDYDLETGECLNFESNGYA